MKRFLVRRKITTLTIGITLLALSFTAVAFSQALAITTNDFVPFSQLVFVPCANGGAGEDVLIEGTLHLQEHITINNNRVNLKIHAQPQGVDGVGQTTGDSYQAVGVTQEQDSIPLLNGAAETTIVNNFRIIGQKTGNNLQVHQNLHITIDANGNVTTLIEHTSVDCN